MKKLLGAPLHVVNIGIASFAEPVRSAGAGATQLEWAPPAQGDRAVADSLGRLTRHPTVEAANRQAFEAYGAASPVVEGIGLARECIPGMKGKLILHAGPPISWERMCGPMQGAIIGALLYEGWATGAPRARAMAASGEIDYAPCHHHSAVGPMSGIISPSMPVWIVRNAGGANIAFSNMNEGLGKVLRFGANGPDVIARLRFLENVLAPTLRAAVRTAGGIDLKSIQAQALLMGDEVHSRNAAATLQFLAAIAVPLADAGCPPSATRESLAFIAANSQFFLNLSMASSKAIMDSAHGIDGCSVVTAIARNGVTTAIRVSGLGSRWFEASSDMPVGLFFPGFAQADANADLGDSAICETAGFGGFSLAASPALVQLVGGTVTEAIAYSREMYEITVARNPALSLPNLDFAGAPCGIDIRKVVDTGIRPAITTGIAHKSPGIGQIGAGIVRTPMACFAQAVQALARSLC